MTLRSLNVRCGNLNIKCSDRCECGHCESRSNTCAYIHRSIIEANSIKPANISIELGRTLYASDCSLPSRRLSWQRVCVCVRWLVFASQCRSVYYCIPYCFCGCCARVRQRGRRQRRRCRRRPSIISTSTRRPPSLGLRRARARRFACAPTTTLISDRTCTRVCLHRRRHRYTFGPLAPERRSITSKANIKTSQLPILRAHRLLHHHHHL